MSRYFESSRPLPLSALPLAGGRRRATDISGDRDIADVDIRNTLAREILRRKFQDELECGDAQGFGGFGIESPLVGRRGRASGVFLGRDPLHVWDTLERRDEVRQIINELRNWRLDDCKDTLNDLQVEVASINRQLSVIADMAANQAAELKEQRVRDLIQRLKQLREERGEGEGVFNGGVGGFQAQARGGAAGAGIGGFGGAAGGGGVFEPDADILDAGTHYRVLINLPGVSRENVNIESRGNSLNVFGDLKTAGGETGETGGNVVRGERATGRFSKVVNLPANANVNEAQATLQDGVLQITCPKTTEGAGAAQGQGKRVELHE